MLHKFCTTKMCVMDGQYFDRFSYKMSFGVIDAAPWLKYTNNWKGTLHKVVFFTTFSSCSPLLWCNLFELYRACYHLIYEISIHKCSIYGILFSSVYGTWNTSHILLNCINWLGFVSVMLHKFCTTKMCVMDGQYFDRFSYKMSFGVIEAAPWLKYTHNWKGTLHKVVFLLDFRHVLPFCGVISSNYIVLVIILFMKYQYTNALYMQYFLAASTEHEILHIFFWIVLID